MIKTAKREAKRKKKRRTSSFANDHKSVHLCQRTEKCKVSQTSRSDKEEKKKTRLLWRIPSSPDERASS